MKSLIIVYSAALSAVSISLFYNGFTPTCVAFGVLYLTVLPRAYFPSLFKMVYALYCSKRLGYHLRHMLHGRVSRPHSDFRPGISQLPQGMIGSDVLRNLPVKGAVVVPVPILADNYAYLILCCETKMAVVVDPADPLRVVQMLDLVNSETSSHFVLTDVLCSHKHWDHAGGNRELLAFARSQSNLSNSVVSPSLKIYGSRIDNPDASTHLLDGGDAMTVAGNIRVRVLHSPGHTSGSVMFLLSADGPDDAEIAPRTALFTGDCIFCGGCGAMFEVKSVSDVLQTYDLFFDDKLLTRSEFHSSPVREDHVLIYVGHEYTERLFGELCVEAAKTRTEDRLPYEKALLEQGELIKTLRRTLNNGQLPPCTVPSTLGIERRTNPLLTLQRDVLSAHSGDGLENLIYGSRARRSSK